MARHHDPGMTASQHLDAARASRQRGLMRKGPGSHPFAAGEDGSVYADVESRLGRVREMGAEQLRSVIEWPGIQKSVVQAAFRRLRKLKKEEKARG